MCSYPFTPFGRAETAWLRVSGVSAVPELLASYSRGAPRLRFLTASHPQDLRPELLRRLLRKGQVERVTLRAEHRPLPQPLSARSLEASSLSLSRLVSSRAMSALERRTVQAGVFRLPAHQFRWGRDGGHDAPTTFDAL